MAADGPLGQQAHEKETSTRAELRPLTGASGKHPSSPPALDHRSSFEDLAGCRFGRYSDVLDFDARWSLPQPLRYLGTLHGDLYGVAPCTMLVAVDPCKISHPQTVAPPHQFGIFVRAEGRSRVFQQLGRLMYHPAGFPKRQQYLPFVVALDITAGVPDSIYIIADSYHEGSDSESEDDEDPLAFHTEYIRRGDGWTIPHFDGPIGLARFAQTLAHDEKDLLSPPIVLSDTRPSISYVYHQYDEGPLVASPPIKPLLREPELNVDRGKNRLTNPSGKSGPSSTKVH